MVMRSAVEQEPLVPGQREVPSRTSEGRASQRTAQTRLCGRANAGARVIGAQLASSAATIIPEQSEHSYVGRDWSNSSDLHVLEPRESPIGCNSLMVASREQIF